MTHCEILTMRIILKTNKKIKKQKKNKKQKKQKNYFYLLYTNYYIIIS